jgi:hypothetical protein
MEKRVQNACRLSTSKERCGPPAMPAEILAVAMLDRRFDRRGPAEVSFCDRHHRAPSARRSYLI